MHMAFTCSARQPLHPNSRVTVYQAGVRHCRIRAHLSPPLLEMEMREDQISVMFLQYHHNVLIVSAEQVTTYRIWTLEGLGENHIPAETWVRR